MEQEKPTHEHLAAIFFDCTIATQKGIQAACNSWYGTVSEMTIDKFRFILDKYKTYMYSVIDAKYTFVKFEEARLEKNKNYFTIHAQAYLHDEDGQTFTFFASFRTNGEPTPTTKKRGSKALIEQKYR